VTQDFEMHIHNRHGRGHGVSKKDRTALFVFDAEILCTKLLLAGYM
jgi:hypothetical protein